MGRIVEQGVIALLGAIAVAYVVLPTEVGEVLAPVTSGLVAGIRWANEVLPQPAFLLLIFAVLTVTAILFVIALARACYPLLQYAGPRTKRLYGFVTPDTPIGKMATGIMLMVFVVFGSIWGLPAAVGDLGQGGYGSQANNLAERGLNSDPITFDQQDVLESGSSASVDAAAYERPTPDADGDRLKNSWESAGETPEGAPLPNADPERMDLYVQVNYGGGTMPLSGAEKRQLRRVWDKMPVDNPDGSQGIDIHITDSRPRGGPVGEPVTISGNDLEEIHQYYTERYMGPRTCRYQQVVLGSITRSNVGGIATTPGYAAVVEDLDRQSEGDGISPRVAVITHELLHNVAGDVTASGHVEQGWLSKSVGSDDTQLSETTAAHIDQRGLVGSGYFQSQICSG